MKKVDFSLGMKLGLQLLIFNVLLAYGSYWTGCWWIDRNVCSIQHSISWLLQHPVFPFIIPAGALLGFATGAFGGIIASVMAKWTRGWTDRHQSLITWAFVLLLIISFILWGLPDMNSILRR